MTKLLTANDFVDLLDEILLLARSQHRESEFLGRAVTFTMSCGRLCIGFEHGYVQLNQHQLRGLFMSESGAKDCYSDELYDGVDLDDWL